MGLSLMREERAGSVNGNAKFQHPYTRRVPCVAIVIVAHHRQRTAHTRTKDHTESYTGSSTLQYEDVVKHVVTEDLFNYNISVGSVEVAGGQRSPFSVCRH